MIDAGRCVSEVHAMVVVAVSALCPSLVRMERFQSWGRNLMSRAWRGSEGRREGTSGRAGFLASFPNGFGCRELMLMMIEDVAKGLLPRPLTEHARAFVWNWMGGAQSESRARNLKMCVYDVQEGSKLNLAKGMARFCSIFPAMVPAE